MKVLLVDPPELFLRGDGSTRFVQPLGLGCVGAAAAPHHDVRFLLPDTRSYVGDDPWGEIRRAIEAEAPDVVGLTCVTATYPSAVRVASLAKEVDPDIVTVLGGVHATTLPEEALLGAAAVDYVVAGEGELTFADLLFQLERVGGRRDFQPADVPGLVFRDPDTGRPRRAPHRPPCTDLDALPFPLRQGVVWGEDDLHVSFYQGLVTVRGCPYRCIYCAVPGLDDRRTRYRSAGHVTDEIADLVRRWEVPYLFFHDSVFSLNRRRTIALCEAMVDKGLNLPFTCQTRADRVDLEVLDHMKAAGCSQIFFGIESGDERSLEQIRKAMPLSQIRDAVKMVRDAGIRSSGFFMIGFPWEDAGSIERTAAFATDLGLDAISLFSATPLPGTELWDLAGGRHLPDSIDFRTPQVNLTPMSDDDYAQLYEDVQGRIDAYNRERMMRSVGPSTHWLSAPVSVNAASDAAGGAGRRPPRVVAP